jgi:hypothetical protein
VPAADPTDPLEGSMGEVLTEQHRAFLEANHTASTRSPPERVYPSSR